MQAAEDTARLTEMQDSVMSLTKQVQQLLPLQPRCSAVETERDAAQLKLDRLQVRLRFLPDFPQIILPLYSWFAVDPHCYES